MKKDPKQMSKLEKMKMPEKRKADEGLDLSNLGGQEDYQGDEGGDSSGDDSEAPDSSNEHMDEMPDDSEQHPSNAALEKASDDELMAEVEKRGLVKKLEESEGEGDQGAEHNDSSSGESDQDMYS